MAEENKRSHKRKSTQKTGLDSEKSGATPLNLVQQGNAHQDKLTDTRKEMKRKDKSLS
jgi:hypothetical protein